MISVSAQTHPFREKVHHWKEELGCSVDQIVDKLHPRARKHPVLVQVAGEIVPRNAWRLVRPRDGDVVSIRIIPTNKGKSSTLARLGLLAGGAALTAFLSRSGKPSPTAQNPFAGNGISPPPEPAPQIPNIPVENFGGIKDSLLAQITGVSNQANQYGRWPRVYGTYQVAPCVVAAPFYQVEGGQQWLYVVLSAGYGRLDLSDFRIGNIPIAVFEAAGVLRKEIKYGEVTDTPIELYPNDVFPKAIGELISTTANPIIATQHSNVLSVDITFPDGLFGFDDPTADYVATGLQVHNMNSAALLRGRVNATATFQVGYRLAGSGGAYTTRNITITDSTPGVKQYTENFPVAVAGVYEVYVIQTGDLTGTVRTYDTTHSDGAGIVIQLGGVVGTTTVHHRETITNHARWESLKAIDTTIDPTSVIRDVNGDIVAMTYIALKVKASELTNGVLDNFTCMARSYLKVFNGTDWDDPEVISANPAWCLADAICGAPGNRRIGYDYLDGPALLELAEWCDSEGFEFNHCFDEETTLPEVGRRIASVCLGSMHVSDGLLTCVPDKSRDTIAMMFTASNCNTFKLHGEVPEVPHAVRAKFVNPLADWSTDEITVYDDGYTKSNSNMFSVMDLIGVTNAVQAYKIVRQHLAALRLRRRKISLSCDLQHLHCNRGDRVLVNCDTTLSGLQSAYIREITEEGDFQIKIRLDQLVYFDSTKAYEVRIRQSDNSYLTKAVIGAAEGYTDELIFVTPISVSDDPKPEVMNLISYGYQGLSAEQFLVNSIRHNAADLSANIELIEYREGVYQAWLGPIHDYTPNWSIQHPSRLIVEPPQILGVKSDENVMLRTGSVQVVRILVSFNAPISTGVTHVEAQYRQTGAASWGGTIIQPVSDAHEIYVQPVETLRTYDIRIRFRTANNKASEWSYINEHLCIGTSTKPPKVPELRRQGTSLIAEYDSRFGITVPPDFAGFDGRWAQGDFALWEDMHSYGPVQTSNSFDLTKLPDGDLVFAVKAVDTAGNRSEEATFCHENLTESLVQNAYVSYPESPGWTGTRENAEVDGNDLVAADSGALFRTGDQFFDDDPTAPFFGSDAWLALTYTWEYLPDSTLNKPYKIFVPSKDTNGNDLILGITKFIEYRRKYSQTPFFNENPDAPFFDPDPASPFRPAVVGEEWKAMPQEGLEGSRETFEFRARILPGASQPKLKEGFGVLIGLPTVEDEFSQIILANSGNGTALALTKTFRFINTILSSIPQTVTYPDGARIEIDLTVMPPVVLVKDTAGNPVDAEVVFRVRGV